MKVFGLSERQVICPANPESCPFVNKIRQVNASFCQSVKLRSGIVVFMLLLAISIRVSLLNVSVFIILPPKAIASPKLHSHNIGFLDPK